MIKNLWDKHPGARIAVVGSGPSADLYPGNAQISIGVNGAALLGPRYDYFLAGDHNAPAREWFNINCSNIRVIAELIATTDKQLYPDIAFPDLVRMAVPVHKRRDIPEVPRPVSPHITFKYRSFKDVLPASRFNFLMYRGTISCCALQLAWMMGAREVDLYGCNFTHKGGSYFYKSEFKGRVVETQYQVMQAMINQLRDNGLLINIHGSSRLV